TVSEFGNCSLVVGSCSTTLTGLVSLLVSRIWQSTAGRAAGCWHLSRTRSSSVAAVLLIWISTVAVGAGLGFGLGFPLGDGLAARNPRAEGCVVPARAGQDRPNR